MSNLVPKPLDEADVAFIERNYRIVPEEGLVYSKDNRPLGTLRSSGYVVLMYRSYKTGKNRFFKRSHLIWYKYTGEWPTQEVDHEDRDKANDKIDNLMPKTHRDNIINRALSDRELPIGVYPTPNSRINPFMAIITHDNKRKHIGCYTTSELASEAYQNALKELNHVD